MSPHNLAELARINEELKREITERKKAEQELEQRTKLLSTLLDVSNLVTSTLGIKSLLEAILDKLKTIIDYTGAKIFVIEDDLLKVVAHRSAMTDEQVAGYYFQYDKVPMGKAIITNKTPVIIQDIWGDTDEAIDFRSAMEAHLIEGSFKRTRSWIGIPMIVKDKVVGALTIDHELPGFYNQQHIALGMAFANQAAVEFENVRLYKSAYERADELRTMLSIQQAITSRLDLDTVLKLIADESRRLTNCDSTSVFLVDGDELVFSVYSGKGHDELMGYRMPIANSSMGRSMLEGRSVILKDAMSQPNTNKDLLTRGGVKNLLSVPLIYGKKPVGIISAINKSTADFSENDERILRMFASSAAIGIENARQYEEERRQHLEDEKRRQVAEGLRYILAILNSNRPLNEILEFIIEDAASLMKTDTGALYRLQKERGLLTLEATCGLPKPYFQETTMLADVGIVSQALRERKPIVVKGICSFLSEQAVSDPDAKAKLTWQMDCCNGMVVVPIIGKEETFGCIILYIKQSRDLTEEELDLVATYADQAALAIDNARLKAHAEKSAATAERSRLARDLHDAVTQTLFSASLIAEVLPKIWDKNQEEGRKRLEEIRQLTRGALAEMRTLLLELRPAALVEASLEELLKHIAEATTGRARLAVNLKTHNDVVLPTDVKIGFYRVAQEAMNNIAKHSGAKSADVTLQSFVCKASGKKNVELIIHDNGKGFDPLDITGEHLGLGIMRERAEAIGARLAIDSKVGEGTDIYIRWEVQENVE